MIKFRVVIDTNVLFEGLTKQGGASGLLIEAWLNGLFEPCVSNSLAYEYADVLTRKLSVKRWNDIKPVLGKLLRMSEFTVIYFSWRPSSPDPGDEHLIDCAMNANATLVTWNMKDFERAKSSLGLNAVTPTEFIIMLTEEEE